MNGEGSTEMAVRVRLVKGNPSEVPEGDWDEDIFPEKRSGVVM